MAAAHDQPVYFDELAELFKRFAADTDCVYRGWVEAHVPRRRRVRRAADRCLCQRCEPATRTVKP